MRDTGTKRLVLFLTDLICIVCASACERRRCNCLHNRDTAGRLKQIATPEVLAFQRPAITHAFCDCERHPADQENVEWSGRQDYLACRRALQVRGFARALRSLAGSREIG
jgi:hypothetical protein